VKTFLSGKTVKLRLAIHIPWGHVSPNKKKIGPIGSAVSTFLGYNQTNKRQTNLDLDLKLDLYLDLDMDLDREHADGYYQLINNNDNIIFVKYAVS